MALKGLANADESLQFRCDTDLLYHFNEVQDKCSRLQMQRQHSIYKRNKQMNGVSLVEWPWLTQPRPNNLSDPISILFRIKDLCFSPFPGYCQGIATPRPSYSTAWEFRLISGESLMRAIWVSLRVKMKRFNIYLFVPILQRRLWSSTCTQTQAALRDATKARFKRNFHEVEGSAGNIIVVKQTEML